MDSVFAHVEQLCYLGDAINILGNDGLLDEPHKEEGLLLARFCIGRLRGVICGSLDRALKDFGVAHDSCLSRLSPRQHAVPVAQPFFFKGWADGHASISSSAGIG